tara:strand:+ start:711 stop:947 length:237 start_codon:yes stop_codon:yes gene_type:complete
MKDYNNINTFDELIELEHGKIGTENRNKYEEGAQMFIVSEMLKTGRISCVGFPRATKIAPHWGAALDIVVWIAAFRKC